jgi:hypothetical protein
MSQEPLFTPDERVPTTQLPDELKGVTDPLKIAVYYQRREGALREEMRRSATPPNSRVTIEHPTQNEPNRDERQSVQFSPEEATAARHTLVATAKQTARQGKQYWDRLETEINKIMAEQPPENQVSVQIWETAYHTLLGMNMQRLTREDAEAAATATRTAAERASTPSSENAPPPPLPIEVTGKILPGLNLTEEQYRTSQEHIRTGKWPLTAENVSGKRVTVGGN